jgi:D-alanyl-D-alanine carboxypeptidase
MVIAVALALVAGMLAWRSGVASSLFGGDGGSGPGAVVSSPGATGTAGSTPSASLVSPSPSPAADAPPACAYRSKPAPNAGYAQWRTTLLDTTYRLRPGYAPPDLVPVSEAGFHSGVLIRRVVLQDLTALRAAALAAGHPLEVVAAYRSYQYQADLFVRRAERLGVEQARLKTARPGHSEHQLGTALDFKRSGVPTTSVSFGKTATGKWLMANASSHGFVLSYPPGKESVTCYGYEPWHFRYVGRKAAARIVASGLTTREYLWAHRPPKHSGARPAPTPSSSVPAPTATP